MRGLREISFLNPESVSLSAPEVRVWNANILETLSGMIDTRPHLECVTPGQKTSDSKRRGFLKDRCTCCCFGAYHDSTP